MTNGFLGLWRASWSGPVVHGPLAYMLGIVTPMKMPGHPSRHKGHKGQKEGDLSSGRPGLWCHPESFPIPGVLWAMQQIICIIAVRQWPGLSAAPGFVG